jgi:2-polyprenyl-6-hydroxyphenyl methylase/3-demethylubiquinone-9 3-methyltransferase
MVSIAPASGVAVGYLLGQRASLERCVTTDAFSFQVATTDQAETDRYWNAIVGDGGQESACGWCKDKWGLSWQITPIVLTQAITDPDRAVATRAFDAMMQMTKIDVAANEAARRG